MLIAENERLFVLISNLIVAALSVFFSLPKTSRQFWKTVLTKVAKNLGIEKQRNLLAFLM